MKLGRDVDPFLGLIQALALSVQLAGPAQRNRIVRNYPDLSAVGPLGCVVIIANRGEVTSRAKYWWKLEERAVVLAAARSGAKELASLIHPVAILEASFTERTRLQAPKA